MGIRRGTNSSKYHITQDFFFHFYFNNQTKHLYSTQSGEHTTHRVMSRLLRRDRPEQPLFPQFLIPVWNLGAWSCPQQV